MTSVDLPEPETPVTQQNTPSGNETSTPVRLCWRALRTTSSPRGSPPVLRHVDRPLAGEVLARQRGGFFATSLRRALGDHVAAVLAGTGAEIDEVVGGAHRALVVLDHDHGVAEVAQPVERRDQLLVVALVEADRGLVEDVEHADKARADLRRQPDPLRLAARERAGRALQRQVADPDVVEEGEALADLARDQASDRALGLGELEVFHPLARGAGAQHREVVDAEPVDQHGEALGAQPGAVAGRAGLLGHVPLDPLTHLL